MIDRGRRRWMGAGAAVLAGVGAPAIGAPLPQLYSSVRRSVVAVGTFNRLRVPQFRFLGSGFAVGSGTRVATCAHVIAGVDESVSETLAIGVPYSATEPPRIAEAKIFGRDADADLATIDISGPALEPLRLGPDELVPVGSDVALIGYPLGTGLGLVVAVHKGVVAAFTLSHLPTASSAALTPKAVQASRSRVIELLQLDMTAYPGNSGSPLVDIESGAVVGILNMGLIKGARETAFSQPTGISYAVPVKYLRPLAPAR